MNDAVHGTARVLNRLLERVHCASDVLFERISHQNVIVLGIAVIGTRPRKVVDPVVCVALGAGAMGSIFARRTRGRVARCRCARGRSLFGEKLRSAGYRAVIAVILPTKLRRVSVLIALSSFVFVGRNASLRSSLFFPSLYLAPEHRDRRFRQGEDCPRLCFDGGRRGRIVGISMTVGPVVDPNILFTAESHQGDWT